MPKQFPAALILTGAVLLVALVAAPVSKWKHLSSATGDLPTPNTGKEQTSVTVADFDRDGVNDFVITERTEADSVVLFRRGKTGWTRWVIENQPLHIEAGSAAIDVDGDGDLDFIAGGDWKSNEIWWWENPYPNFDPAKPWKRHVVKNTGSPKHHDQIAADLDGCGKPELVFWNQDAHGLFVAKIPPNPREAESWPILPVYTYSADSEPVQRGEPASFRGVNEHEGLAVVDVDGDGKLDIVGGGRWFKNLGGLKFQENLIDPSYSFSRAAAGHLIKGSQRAQAVFVVGDGDGPLNWYEWVKGTWIPHKLADIHYGHSLQVVDVDGDGNLDIFCAEQRLNGNNPQSKIYIFYGDGHGNFTPSVMATGFDLHEAKVADLDGDGRLDILGKPYNYQTPRIDIWLNLGFGGAEK
jgi:hypothetical protein